MDIQKISEFDPLALADLATDDKLPIVDTSASQTKYINHGDIKGYKSYAALISQSGTNAPTAQVLYNTLGGTVVWGRTSAGVYTATLAGVFTSNKTFCLFTNGEAARIGACMRTDDNTVTLYLNNDAGTAADDLITLASLEIRVYP